MVFVFHHLAYFTNCFLEIKGLALAGFVVVSSSTQNCCGFNPSQGTYPGCRFDPNQGVYGRQPNNVCLSLSLSSPTFPLFLKLINMSLSKDLKIEKERNLTICGSMDGLEGITLRI